MGVGRAGRWLAFLVLGCLAAAASADPPPSPRIVAVGDLHGDFAAWRAIAQAAGVENAAGHWSGGTTILVQTGDMVDRGPASLAVVQDLMRLQREAPATGGRVVVLVGNHEAMNVTDDLRYVVPADYEAFATPDSAALRDQVFDTNRAQIVKMYHKRNPLMRESAVHDAYIADTPLGKIEHQHAWHAGGTIGSWVAHSPAVVLIDGNLFVHGGISAGYARRSIDQINREVDAALQKQDISHESILADPLGPLWYRGLVSRDPKVEQLPDNAPDQPSIEDEVATVLKAYGAKRIIVGHTPILSGIAILDDGKLVRIDTGISIAYGGAVTFLEITNGTLVPHHLVRPH